MSSFAPELWDLVPGHVADSARGDLLRCAQVCRVWYCLAVARFYHSVEVDATPSSPWVTHKRHPPILPAKTFRLMVDARSLAVDAMRALKLNLGATLDDCLLDMALPPDHRVASLSLRSSVDWLIIDEKLRLSATFAAITSLHLNSASMESTSVFAAAMAQFPLLRRLTFSGWISDQNLSSSNVLPPSFAQPCALRLEEQGFRTWTEILQWVLLDASKFSGISLDLANPDMFWKFIHQHRDLVPLVRDVSAAYVSNPSVFARVEIGQHGCQRFSTLSREHLRIVRLATSCGPKR
ncbi:hypothetical protein AURDEDRAFT_130859 [Auricularia subglabra TFB-10046 SS5]|nr:hypothetical protein AURDEDRAFT_130859 [Auricularia subglabra TFB-10046 SS5]